nr:MAG TPA: hypothetical protein [Caudoviricetes sp.]
MTHPRRQGPPLGEMQSTTPSSPQARHKRHTANRPQENR